jgi:hypothetical protein
MHPVWAPWRSLRARALTATGDGVTARALLASELELTRRAGAAWGIGRSLRLLGEVEGGDAGVAHLREAIAILDGTEARLERAKAHAALAFACDDDGERAIALELARTCGAAGLAARLAQAS